MSLEQKKALFHEFFTLPLALTVNLKALSAGQTEPDEESLEQEIPYPFKLAAEFKNMSQSHSFRGLSEDLIGYLNTQNRKIDLVLSYLLMNEDSQAERYQSTTFGAGGLTFESTDDWQLEQSFRLKIFLPEEACAVYCYGQIIDKQTIDKGYLYQLVYSQILEQDREVLVRAALHEQSKQLRALAKKRAAKTHHE